MGAQVVRFHFALTFTVKCSQQQRVSQATCLSRNLRREAGRQAFLRQSALSVASTIAAVLAPLHRFTRSLVIHHAESQLLALLPAVAWEHSRSCGTELRDPQRMTACVLSSSAGAVAFATSTSSTRSMVASKSLR